MARVSTCTTCRVFLYVNMLLHILVSLELSRIHVMHSCDMFLSVVDMLLILPLFRRLYMYDKLANLPRSRQLLNQFVQFLQSNGTVMVPVDPSSYYEASERVCAAGADR